MQQTPEQVQRRVSEEMLNKIRLDGCSPNPLASNLKALGIFRIMAEQADPDVTAYWEGDVFVLQTKMTQGELIEFFLERYAPTPFVSPWNNGSGFYDDKKNIIDEIKESKDERLEEYRKILNQCQEILKDMSPEYAEFIKRRDQNIKEGSPKDGSLKEDSKKIRINDEKKKKLLLRQCRNRLDNSVVPWMDTAYVVTSAKPTFGPILGSGGNDGNMDFSSNFMEWINRLINHTEHAELKEGISNSFFNTTTKLESGSFGYFHPGAYTSESVNGNKTTFVNPWDYILTMEGTVIFAGSISRRSNSRRAAFPFSTDSSTAGYGTACEEKTRGEIWIPLWKNPATYDEIKYTFNEGRGQTSSKNSNSGVDFAKAIASLGTERGLSEFQRFGLFERKGQAYFANSIGRIRTNDEPNVELFSDIEGWINRIRQIHDGAKKSSKSIDSLLRSIDNAIIKFCTYGTSTYQQEVLILVGKMEKAVSQSSNYNNKIEPLPELSHMWIQACYDGTPEFRLAVSLASMSAGSQKRLRINLESVKINGNKIEWREKSPSMVWRNSSLISNMIRILERRCMEAQMSKSEIPLNSTIHAPIKDIVDFIEGKINYHRIYDLLLPLSIVNYENVPLPDYHNERKLWDVPDFVPEPYIVLKSNFPPISYKNAGISKNALFEPSVPRLLKAGMMGKAAHITRRRLHITGYGVSTYCNATNHVSTKPKHMMDRISASLLFPSSKQKQEEILKKILKQNQALAANTVG